MCIEFENATPRQKEVLQHNYQIHQVNKADAREIKANEKLLAEKNPQTRACLAFDLRQVLNVPYGENGLFYYSRKLAVYNLTVTDLATKDGYCYTWDQTTAKRGANEMGSCIFSHVKDNLKDHEFVTLFSDNCSGQNKNRYIYEIMPLLIIKM